LELLRQAERFSRVLRGGQPPPIISHDQLDALRATGKRHRDPAYQPHMHAVLECIADELVRSAENGLFQHRRTGPLDRNVEPQVLRRVGKKQKHAVAQPLEALGKAGWLARNAE